MRTITGTVEKFIYRNEDNGFGVVVLSGIGDAGKRTVTGTVAQMKVGTQVSCEGDDVQTKYGPQFKVSSWEERRPTDTEGIEKYLASGLIKNIGPVLAHDIVSVFGEDTLDVLDNHPERLAEVPGIGRKRIKSIRDSVKEQKAIRSVMIWLKRYDLPNGLAAKIYKYYGEKSIAVLEGNPYRLADEIKGIGFKKADQVAILLGIAKDSPFRIQSGILHAVTDFTDEGSTYMPVDMMLDEASGENYLSLPKEQVQTAYEQWRNNGTCGEHLVVEEERIYPKWLYYAELNVAKRLAELNRSHLQRDLFNEDEQKTDIQKIQELTGVTYNEKQAEAITAAVSGGVLVLTGGPGTGKTVTTNGIISALEADGGRVLLCAPTGRAAKRMSEVTGRPAKTIHRLLGYGGDGFSFNKDCTLKGKAVVIDESSMIDISLMSSLLSAVPDGMKVILVGDVDQLPSVGSGSVLRDIINSGIVPTVRLTEIYRQAQGSDIIMGAHAVNHGRMPKLDNNPGTDLWFITREDQKSISDTIVDLVTSHLPKKVGVPAEDIQVLSPMRREGDLIGIKVLNSLLQAKINPSGTSVTHEGQLFRVGDKVMQIKNDYDKNVFNGDTGRVTGVLPEGGLLVDFQGTLTEYAKNELGSLELAYASTVHKSQGSEYPVVVIPVHRSHFILLKRNLLYTAITRAKKMCILVGSKQAVAMAVAREDTQNRYSFLSEKLKQL